MAQLHYTYKAMVAQKAWECWKRLPPQTRVWIDVEDLVQDGLALLDNHIRKRFKSNKAAIGTFIWIVLEHFYRNITIHHYAKKRFDGKSCSITDMEDFYVQEDFCDEYHSTEALLALYARASRPLREYLECWFFAGQRHRKLRIKTKGFEAVREEFRELAWTMGLTADDCRQLLMHESWRKRLPLNWREVL